MISISQPTSWEARRTFWPRLPIASDSWSSGTTTSMRRSAASMTTLVTSAGCRAFTTKVAVSGDQGMISTFSPPSSLTTAWTRLPRMPTQAPTGSIDSSLVLTAIFARLPASRAHRANLDDSVVDLRNLHLEQLPHEVRMNTADEDLRPACFGAHIIDVGPHPVAPTQGFARQAVVAPQHGLGAAKIDDLVTAFLALDDAVDDLPDCGPCIH